MTEADRRGKYVHSLKLYYFSEKRLSQRRKSPRASVFRKEDLLDACREHCAQDEKACQRGRSTGV